MKRCSVIDAPSGLGLRAIGVARLPGALRDAGILEALPDVHYAGRVPVPHATGERDRDTSVLDLEGVRTFALRLAERVAFTLDLGRFPVVLGGDCSILLGPALALRRRGRFGLFFIDGHADFYSPETEPVGEAASMELALCTGRGPSPLADLNGLGPLLRDEDVVAFGFRDAESAAQEGSPDLRATGIHAIDLAGVRRLGAAAAAAEGLRLLESGGVEGFWIHLDADALDDGVMPAVDYRMPDGLTPEELTTGLGVVLRSPLALGMDITIYNPTLDDAVRSAGRLLARCVTGAFASR